MSQVTQENKEVMEEKQVEEQKETYDAHRSYVKLHFDDQEMDFAFQWLLGAISNGGGEIGEAFYTAGSIKDGDPASWQQEWDKMAQKVEARAITSLKAGHKVSARESYLRASNYYRTALVSMLADNPRFHGLGKKMRECIKEAAKLYDPPMEFIEIPFEGTVLPGFYMKVDDSGKKRKTLLMIGGTETFIEDNFFYIAPQAIKRGYNYVTIDLPGQGFLPAEGKFFRADVEVPMKAVLDFVYSQPEIDTDQMGVYGISNGGYFVPRAAQHDKRIKVIAVSSAVVDNYRMFSQMPFAKCTQEEIDNWSPFKLYTTGAVAWRWGCDRLDVKAQVEKTKDCQFDPKQVDCPFLDLVGEGEYKNEETQRQQKECLDNLPNPNKKFIITPANEGASSHCIGENRKLMSQIVFDWMDEIFGE